jgi:hypothetical protein
MGEGHWGKKAWGKGEFDQSASHAAFLEHKDVHTSVQ